MNKQLEVVLRAIDEKKGKDMVAYEYTQLNPFIDYTVIASATNQRQVFALANNVVERAYEAGIKVRKMEGDKDSAWILVDLFTIVVHIFHEEERAVYKLEQLYADLPTVEFSL